MRRLRDGDLTQSGCMRARAGSVAKAGNDLSQRVGSERGSTKRLDFLFRPLSNLTPQV